MALYHLSLRKISRSRGSATRTISYISASKLEDIYDGSVYDHRSKQYVDETMVMLPENALEEWHDLQTITNAINQSSNQPQAILCREIEISLPIELSPEKQKEIAKEYIKETFVEDGMAAIVSFHSPLKNPEDVSSYNPHAHIILTTKPLDQEGNWISKTEKKYVCENELGETRLLSALELKQDPSFEKVFHFKNESGLESWHTKSYAATHLEECSQLINRYPKCVQVKHPLNEKWSNPETLNYWREAWAKKVNLTFESLSMSERIDHRSYKKQGLNLIPMVHEGKEIIALERKIEMLPISDGQHTEIRNLNLAIKEHNQEVKMIMEMKKLQIQMQNFMKPVIERLEKFSFSIAEKLERLRTEIIDIRIKIGKAVKLKGQADEKIKSNELYIKELLPQKDERVENLQKEMSEAQNQYDGMNGIFQNKQRQELKEKIDILRREISVQLENREYALLAEKEIVELNVNSLRLGKQISDLEADYDVKVENYLQIEKEISVDSLNEIKMERIQVRKKIEQEMDLKNGKVDFEIASKKIDKKLGCSTLDLLGKQDLTLKQEIKLKGF